MTCHVIKTYSVILEAAVRLLVLSAIGHTTDGGALEAAPELEEAAAP